MAIREGFRVEIQLRTVLQHAWAELVERVDRQVGSRAKFGAADPELAAALASAAEAMAAAERGGFELTAIMEELISVELVARRMR